MTALPSVEQFPSFVETVSLLLSEAQQCIWYLPNKKRLCLVEITAQDKQKAIQLANRIWEPGLITTSAFSIFAEIADRACCGRHHRNKIYGSGLAQRLANRWFNETIANSTLKTEHETVTSPAVAFARHEAYKGESLRSQLDADIIPHASTTGSIYFYTHDGDAFKGMIKIGYTSQKIESRLFQWSQCGYGYPKLLGSVRDVRHPERVEFLTHFELLDWWHELRWCMACGKSHKEWFKVKLERAQAIALLWTKWMNDANPYDRRGILKPRWREHMGFLVEHENPITAKAMVLIHEIEVGSVKVNEFIDDTVLRKEPETGVKKEED